MCEHFPFHLSSRSFKNHRTLQQSKRFATVIRFHYSRSWGIVLPKRQNNPADRRVTRTFRPSQTFTIHRRIHAER